MEVRCIAVSISLCGFRDEEPQLLPFVVFLPRGACADPVHRLAVLPSEVLERLAGDVPCDGLHGPAVRRNPQPARDGEQLPLVPDRVAGRLPLRHLKQEQGQLPRVAGVGGRPADGRPEEVPRHDDVGVRPADAQFRSVVERISRQQVAQDAAGAQFAEPHCGIIFLRRSIPRSSPAPPSGRVPDRRDSCIRSFRLLIHGHLLPDRKDCSRDGARRAAAPRSGEGSRFPDGGLRNFRGGDLVEVGKKEGPCRTAGGARGRKSFVETVAAAVAFIRLLPIEGEPDGAVRTDQQTGEAPDAFFLPDLDRPGRNLLLDGAHGACEEAGGVFAVDAPNGDVEARGPGDANAGQARRGLEDGGIDAAGPGVGDRALDFARPAGGAFQRIEGDFLHAVLPPCSSAWEGRDPRPFHGRKPKGRCQTV
jgi:hypothetical protein